MTLRASTSLSMDGEVGGVGGSYGGMREGSVEQLLPNGTRGSTGAGALHGGSDVEVLEGVRGGTTADEVLDASGTPLHTARGGAEGAGALHAGAIGDPTA